ncbi:hypothetical protein C497_01992 [Halalkalicoccus jeotgali B3]|nr:hypothetical protein C497_01992 [Halalkalicoccus jeotgali B3]
MVLVVVCVLLLVPSVVLFNIAPWQVALVVLVATLVFDALVLVTALLASIVTPSHESTLQYLRSRYAEWHGRETIRSDPTLPSRRDR